MISQRWRSLIVSTILGCAASSLGSAPLVASEWSASGMVASLGEADLAPASAPEEEYTLAPTDFFCEPCDEGWLTNLSFFAGLDGAKQPQDLGINANLGPRVAANWGLPIWREQGIGLQLGVAGVFATNAVAVLERVDGSTDGRNQLFATVGFFQKTDSAWNWSLAWDLLSQSYYDDFLLSQWRGRLGYEYNAQNEFGTWFTVRASSDQGFAGGTPVELRSLNQVNFFWRHGWETGAQTSLWVGLAEQHSEVVYVFPESTTTGIMPVLGAMINVPLNDWAALYGETNLVMPPSSGTVDAFLGVAIFPWGSAKQASQNRFAPLLPVAGSPSFSVDMRR